MSYWEKNKRRLLPKIKDWSDPHNEIRHSNNVRAMTDINITINETNSTNSTLNESE